MGLSNIVSSRMHTFRDCTRGNWDVENNTALVCVGLSARLQLLDQALRVGGKKLRVLARDVVEDALQLEQTEISFAYWKILTDEGLMSWWSETHKLHVNSIGPKMDPWGIPNCENVVINNEHNDTGHTIC